MSMTKDLFFEAIAQALQPTETEIEMQYWYELKQRREMYLAFVTKQVEEMPDNYFFSADFDAWMQDQKAETSKNPAEMLVARRKVGSPIEESNKDLNPHIEDENHQKRNSNLDANFI